MRLYVARYYLKFNHELCDGTRLFIVAPDFAAAYNHAHARRNGLRYSAVHKELIVADVSFATEVPIDEPIEVADPRVRNIENLVLDIVTGEGHQAENLEMSESEWAQQLDRVVKNQEGDADNFPVTMTYPNWMNLVKHAKEIDDERRFEEARKAPR